MTTIRIQRKPVTLEAIQWTGGNWEAVRRFAGDAVHRFDSERIIIHRLTGDSTVCRHEWIIRENGGYWIYGPHELTRDFDVVN